MSGLFISTIYIISNNLFFSKETSKKKEHIFLLKKHKYFTENYFFYKNLLNLKFSKLHFLKTYKDFYKKKYKLMGPKKII